MSKKLVAGQQLPSIRMPAVGGSQLDLASLSGWRMLAVYRGKHCPLCKKYLKALDGLLEEFKAAGVTVVAASADPQEKAVADVAAEGWRFPVGYDMSLDQMRELGLYISEPRSPQEADRPFAEPGLYVVNPQDQLQIIDISNAPFARPDLTTLLMGIKLIQDRNYPIRGTMA